MIPAVADDVEVRPAVADELAFDVRIRQPVPVVVAIYCNTTPRNDEAPAMPSTKLPTGPIEQTPDVCGGKACIAGTRIPVWGLERQRRRGLADMDILRRYPSLSFDDLEAAWDYVKRHQREIDKQIRDNEDAYPMDGVRLYGDEHFPPLIMSFLRQKGYDVLSVKQTNKNPRGRRVRPRRRSELSSFRDRACSRSGIAVFRRRRIRRLQLRPATVPALAGLPSHV